MNTDHPHRRLTGRGLLPPDEGHWDADCPDQAEATIALTTTEVADLVELLDEVDQFLRLGRHSIDALTDFYRTHHDDNHPRFVALCLLDSVSFTALGLRTRARAAGHRAGADQ